jgi:hypothetical protein
MKIKNHSRNEKYVGFVEKKKKKKKKKKNSFTQQQVPVNRENQQC